MGRLPFTRGFCTLAAALSLCLLIVHSSEVPSQKVTTQARGRRSEAPSPTTPNIIDRFALTAKTKWESLWGLSKEAPSEVLSSPAQTSSTEEGQEDGDDVFEKLFLEDPFFDLDYSSQEEEDEEEEEEGEDSEIGLQRGFLEDPYFDPDGSQQDVDDGEMDSEDDDEEEDEDEVFEEQFLKDPFFDLGKSHQYDLDGEDDLGKEEEEVRNENDPGDTISRAPFFDVERPQQHDVFDIKRMKRRLQLKKHGNHQKMKKDMKQRRKKRNKKKKKETQKQKRKKYMNEAADARRMDRLREAKTKATQAEKHLEFFRREKKSRGHVSPVPGGRYLRPPPPPPPPPPADDRPNIILIVADDLGYNDVPWHNPDVRAPNIRKLARQGIILENHYVLPLCTPSRAALLTGVYPFRYGKQAGESLPLSPTGLNTSITLLPERLKDLGYSTHLIGKWHLGYCSWDYTPTRRGFDSFYGYYLGSQTYYTQYKKMGRRKGSLFWWDTNEVDDLEYDDYEESQDQASENLKDDQRKKMEESKRGQGRRRFRGYGGYGSQDDNGGRDFRLNELPLANVSGYYSNDLYAARAEDVIRAHAVEDGVAKSPLFMMLATQAVHGPIQVPLKYRRRHTATTKNLARRTFLGMVDALDDVVGRVVEQLKVSGLYQNTVIIFTTDNGGNIQAGGNNFPLRGSKGGLYEGGTKGVAFIHSPLLPKSGFKYNGMMHIVDLHESILHIARNGASLSRGPGWRRELLDSYSWGEDRDGIDVWPAILTNTDSPRNSFVYNVRKKPLRGAIRRRNWKLIIGEGGKFDGWVPPTDVSAGAQGIDEEGKCCSTWHSRIRDRHLALYNLKDDPLETTDVSYLNPNVTSTLKSLLKKYASQSRQPHLPREDPLGHPSLHGGFFSPGWCQAII